MLVMGTVAGWNPGTPEQYAGEQSVVVELSVIIPAYNAAKYIDEQLEALAQERYDAPWEVIVVDNGSSDGTRAMAARYLPRMPQLRLLSTVQNRGPAHARNYGAAASAGVHLAFIDADDVIVPGWVAAIGKALHQHQFVASRFEFARLNPDWLAKSRTNGQGVGLQRASWLPELYHAGGCGLGVHKCCHELVGGFDESLPFLEDTDYCIRLQLAGVEMQFAPEAAVSIRYRSSLFTMFQQARIWARYNVYLARKHQPHTTVPAEQEAWSHYWGRWRRLLRRALRLRRREDLVAWVRNCGWLIGILQGALSYRFPPI